ncbi:MAG TPA: thioredoxin domain-containing protein [Patescibacteria group bacterium]|nr:thioredoxin domain-containing protein [Patescibacteria group bacterium]
MNKTFWAIIAIIVIVFGGILFFKHNNTSTTNSSSSNSSSQPTSHTTGQGKSGITLVEYGDYQCPFCGEIFPIVNQVVQKYNEQITYQFRNLPLIQIHQNAFAAARAAEAAGKQNKYWEMHDWIYQNQSAWSSAGNVQAIFSSYAQQLGINVDQFKKDFASAAVNDSINADINAFKKTGQDMATPTFFLDGKKISPTPTSVDDFSKLIDAKISAKKQ